MKPRNLKLQDLKVMSFVTSLNDEEKSQAKGGTGILCNIFSKATGVGTLWGGWPCVCIVDGDPFSNDCTPQTMCAYIVKTEICAGEPTVGGDGYVCKD